MTELERRLLARCTTAEAITEFWEMGVRAQHFEEPLFQAVWNFTVDYWQQSQMTAAPTPWILAQEFSGYVVTDDAKEDNDYLASSLQKRYATNQLQEMLLTAARDSVTDPLGALRDLKDTAEKVSDHLAGKADNPGGVAFEGNVSGELDKLRVREEARRRFAIERAGDAPSFDEGLLSEILIRPQEPPFRVADLMPSQSSTLVTAQRKTGKTTLTLNLAHSLITGEPFLGVFPVRPISGRVSFLNFEVSAAQLGRWAWQTGIPEDRFHQVNLRGRRNPFSHPDDRERLGALLRSHEVETLIVDPFGRAYPGSSQNDPGEVGAFLDDLNRFKAEIGAADLILSAHAGWQGEHTRGSSALEDWPDSIITMVANADGLRFLRAIGRDVDVGEDQLSYDPTTRRLWMTGSGSRKRSQEQGKAEALVDPVCAQVQQNPGASQSEIIKALQALHREGTLPISFQERDVVAAINLAVKEGRITREKGGKGKATRHFLVDENQPLPTSAKPPPRGTPPPPPTASIGGGGSSGGSGDNHSGGGSGPNDPTLPGSVDDTSLASPVENPPPSLPVDQKLSNPDNPDQQADTSDDAEDSQPPGDSPSESLTADFSALGERLLAMNGQRSITLPPDLANEVNQGLRSREGAIEEARRR